MLDRMDAFDVVLDKAGSQAALAELCGVRPQAVSRWVRKRRIPAAHCKLIEARLGVPAAEQRSDIFGEKVAA